MLNGVINVYKEKGYTSHDVVAKMRGIFRQKKIGHTGTLDPDAEGVLPVCLGSATKLCEYLTEKQKTYRAVLLLGKTTDTQDITGNVLREREVRCTEEELNKAAGSFLGAYDQIPPMYSALKVNGRKLVDLARKGIEVERQARRVEIISLSLSEIHLPRAVLTVTCSRGTYIRTLCHDIGEKLGTGGCMESLVRLGSGSFRIEDAKRLGELEDAVRNGNAEQYLIPTDQCLEAYPPAEALSEAEKLLRNGNPIPAEMVVWSGAEDGTETAEIVRLYAANGDFAGLYRHDRRGLWRPEKLFLS